VPASAAAPTITSEDLDFSDIKKKKKSGKKKAAFDLDAFEKELNDTKTKSSSTAAPAGEDDEDDGQPVDTSHLDNIDETELGDDPFAQADAPIGVEAGTEGWLRSDRDYTYQEVRVWTGHTGEGLKAMSFTAFDTFLRVVTRR